jgi:hypothetical protein
MKLGLLSLCVHYEGNTSLERVWTQIFHGVNIVSPEEKIKFQGVVDYHDINVDHPPPQSNKKLRWTKPSIKIQHIMSH